MASSLTTTYATATSSTLSAASGTIDSAGAGITGGYTGDSLSLKIIMAFLSGLALYNAVELIVLVFVTFQRYHGLYFWSLILAAFGIIPYSLGFLIKFFQLLDPARDVGYIAVVLLSVGWYLMVSGQSVVLWSRLHLLTSSRRVLRWTLWMIIINGVILHSITTVLTFGSNSHSLSQSTLSRFVHGYSIMEKIQMAGFFVQELILSVIYIQEAFRLLKLSETVQEDAPNFNDDSQVLHPPHGHIQKTMYQLLGINFIIISMDIVLLGVEFANLYIIETTLKGVVYSIKLKLEFAVLGKLVQFVRQGTVSSTESSPRRHSSGPERMGTTTGVAIDKLESNGARRINSHAMHSPSITLSSGGHAGSNVHHFPDFVDPTRVNVDVTHAQPLDGGTPTQPDWETRTSDDEEKRRRRTQVNRGSWIDEEMNKHNIE